MFCEKSVLSTAFSNQRPVPKKRSVQTLTLPRGRKPRNPKSFSAGQMRLHLDGTAQGQINSMLSHAILRCLLQFLPERLLENNLLGLLQVLNSAALRLVRTAAAAFTPVLDGDHKLSVPCFCFLLPQNQLLPCMHVKQSSSGSYFIFPIRPTCF